MAKRFTDTQVWEKEWFMKLSPKLKCLWRYLTERCDQSGVWDPNWQLASIYIGEKVSQIDLQFLGNQIEILPNGKVFIPDFINFQYGQLSEKSPAHKPILRAIKKNDLSNRVFNRVSNTLKEKEEEEEEEMEKEKEEEEEMEKEKEEEEEIEKEGETSIEKKLTNSFDEIYLGKIRSNWNHLDFDFELRTFIEKVRGSPGKYIERDTDGIRLAFQSQLRNAKSKPKAQTGFVS
jgi:hypothetical protein